MLQCSNFQMFKRLSVPMFQCSNVQIFKCSNVKFQMSIVKYQMSNVNKVKFLSELTSGVPLGIFAPLILNLHHDIVETLIQARESLAPLGHLGVVFTQGQWQVIDAM